MRACNRCSESLPDSSFYTQKKRGKQYQYPECRKCFRIRMNERHEETKLVLVNELGAKCFNCNYARNLRILHFHHLDPAEKDFTIGQHPSSNIDVLRKEASKCILLCPTCHAEKHLGVW